MKLIAVFGEWNITDFILGYKPFRDDIILKYSLYFFPNIAAKFDYLEKKGYSVINLSMRRSLINDLITTVFFFL